MERAWRSLADNHYRIWLVLCGFNLLDGVLTAFGLNSGFISEANPLLAWSIERSPTAWIIKLLMPLLYWWLFLRSGEELRWAVVTLGMAVAYLWVLSRHVHWIFAVLST